MHIAAAIAMQERLRDMDAEALRELEHKYDAPIDDCYGPGRNWLSAPMKGLVLLNWRRSKGPFEAEQVSAAKVDSGS